MIFKKVNLSFASLVGILKRGSQRSFRNMSLNPMHIPKSIYNKGLLVCATAIGLSVYITHKTMRACEVDTNIKEEHKTINCKNYEEAISKCRDILHRIKDEKGIPGIVVGVSIDGKTIWEEGLGYADIENRVLCTPDTVMRIASISKSITMAAVAKLWEQGKLDVDKPVQAYVPSFPQKTFNGKPVTITCRQLVSHLGGIRHYAEEKNDLKNAGRKPSKIPEKKEERESREFYLAVKFEDTESALEIFKNDPLIEKPGTKFHYTTFGWTLVSAIVEAVSKEKFPLHMTKLFKALGMKNTYLDENDVIIYHRARNYMKNKHGLLINTPYVDNSYKWAGGGYLSTVGDLLQFANAMLYSSQYKSANADDSVTKNKILDNSKLLENKDMNNNPSNRYNNNFISSEQKLLPGYLTSKTMEIMWASVGSSAPKYGMGWSVCSKKARMPIL